MEARTNPLTFYYSVRLQAKALGATIVLSSETDKIYRHNQEAHTAPFCTTSSPADSRGNTPYLIKLETDTSFEEQIQTIETWIARELEYREQRGY